MKKILVCLLCAALCLGGFSLAEESEWYYDTSWGYVNGYSGSGGDVVVPSEIDGHAVRVIQQKGLTRRDDITSFTVPWQPRHEQCKKPDFCKPAANAAGYRTFLFFPL